jgi:tetratricopeptide (TPR) repeat protein
MQYQYVDTAYARTEASAKAIFELGRLYEEQFGELDSARVTYTRGRTAFPQAEITKEIIRRADYMNRYFTLHAEVSKYDSLLIALDAPPEEASEVDTTAQDSVAQKPPVQPPMPRDTVLARLATSMNELAGVFFIDMDEPDSAAVWYRAVSERFPESRVAPYAMFALAQIYDQDSTVNRAVPDSIRREIVRRFPRTEFASESRRLLGLPQVTIAENPAEELYDLAERRYLNGEYESAVKMFKEIATEYPDSRSAARAEYAAGFIYENNLLQPDSALASYRNLAQNYPSSAFTSRVRPKIQFAEMEHKRIADSLAALAVPDTLGLVTADSLGLAPADSLGRADSLAVQSPDSLSKNPETPPKPPQEPRPQSQTKDLELPGRPKP